MEVRDALKAAVFSKFDFDGLIKGEMLSPFTRKLVKTNTRYDDFAFARVELSDNQKSPSVKKPSKRFRHVEYNTALKDKTEKELQIMDPFNNIVFDCHELILHHFNGLELYKMTKVSKQWKIIVKTDKKAAKKFNTIVNLDLVGHDKDKLVLKLLNNIEYEALTTESDEIGIKSIERFSRSLKCLSISQSKIDNCIYLCPGLPFAQLVSLELEFDVVSFITWLQKCFFPNLKSLCIADYIDDKGNENCYLMKLEEELSSLVTLHLRCVELPLDLQQKEMPQFVNLAISDFSPAITFHSSLISLGIFNIYDDEIDLILSQMKHLKALSISFFKGVKEQHQPVSKMTVNDNISSLEIMAGFNENDTISKILAALPSLISFSLGETVVFPGTLELISE